MVTISKAFSSGFTTGFDGVDGTYLEPPESIGTPGDAKATDVDAENSAFALLKGIASEFGIADGTGIALTSPVSGAGTKSVSHGDLIAVV